MDNIASQVTSQTFDPSQVCRGYNNSQWTAKEDWYVKECDKIQISSSPTTADIQRIAMEIDRLLTIARLDYAFIAQAYDKYNTQLKIEKERLFVDLKLQPPSQYNTLKLTVDEMKGVVASVIQNRKWNNTSYSLFELVEMTSGRNIFMEGVIKILQDKKDLLITHSGMLKIESSVGSMQPNVPIPQGAY